MARSQANPSSKQRNAKKQKLKRAGASALDDLGISNGPRVRPATIASKPMRPKYENRKRGREALVEPSELVTPQMRSLEPGLGILAYKGANEPAAPLEADLRPDSSDAQSEAAEFISLDFDDESTSARGNLLEQFEQYESEHNQEQDLQPIGEFPAPWLDTSIGQKQSIGEQLTAEVIEYMRYVSPSSEETRKRNDCVKRLRRVTQFLWPGCSMDVFGSYAMGMYLPDADIDVVISTAGSIRPIKLRNEMYRLSARMKKSQLADRVEVIAKARVPIVKYVDKATGLNVDIAFDQSSGFDGLTTVASWVAEQPALKPLVLVIKQFLKRRRLNEVVNGGLGGYAVICLVYALLRSHEDFGKDPKLALENVGLLLIAFFDLYGYQFDYRHYAVSVKSDAGCIMKSTNPDMETQRPNGLAVEDPNDTSNNISKASFNYQSIERSFGLASDLLKRLSISWRDMPVSQRPRLSFLAPLLRYDRKMNVHRGKVNLELALKPAAVMRPNSLPLNPRSIPDSSEKKRLAGTEELRNKKRRPLSQEKPLPPTTKASRSLPEARTQRAGTSDVKASRSDSRKAHDIDVKMPGAKKPVSDPFQEGSYASSSDISDDETAKPAVSSQTGSHTKPKPQNTSKQEPSLGMSEKNGGNLDSDDNTDSRTRLTSSERRQFWKRKGELPEDLAEASI